MLSFILVFFGMAFVLLGISFLIVWRSQTSVFKETVDGTVTDFQTDYDAESWAEEPVRYPVIAYMYSGRAYKRTFEIVRKKEFSFGEHVKLGINPDKPEMVTITNLGLIHRIAVIFLLAGCPAMLIGFMLL